MLTIHLIRHAKSSWDDNTLLDVERPLKQRGINDCELMAFNLLATGANFNNIYCSQAVRAQQTIQLICNALPEIDVNWLIEKQLYCFDYLSVINWLSNLPDGNNEVTLVGHNPAFTDLINYLSDKHIDNLPTCGYAQLVSNQLSSWLQIARNKFSLNHYLTPKQFKN